VGLTTLELLIALLFVLGIMGSAIVAFVALQRHSTEVKARLDAMSEARHALFMLSQDLSQAQFGPATATPKNMFMGANSPSAQGNRKDDDGDGKIDEEVFDGKDDDNDWQSQDDKHALITPVLRERPQGYGFPDIGDSHVDEDTRFGQAQLRFRIPAETTGSVAEIYYHITTFDGEPNVLVREKTTSGVTEIGPVAFNVLSFSALFWDSNAPAGPTRTWLTSWDSTVMDETSQLVLPVSVALEVTIYAGSKKLSTLPPNSPLETVRLTTVVNVEAALNDAKYERNSLP